MIWLGSSTRLRREECSSWFAASLRSCSAVGSSPRHRSIKLKKFSETNAPVSPGSAIQFTISCSGHSSSWANWPKYDAEGSVLFRESGERGDLYATSMLTSFYMTMIHLAGNQQIDSETERELEATVNRPNGSDFTFEQLSAFDSLTNLNLYRGDIASAWVRMGRVWPEYRRSRLFRIQMIRISLLELRARTALAMAEKDAEPAAYIQQAAQDAEALDAEGLPWALAHASYIRAGIAACVPDAARAIKDVKLAAQQYDDAEMPLRAQILRYRLGELEEGAESRELRENAELWINGQGIVSPVRWAGMYAPGFALISKTPVETTF